MSQENVEIVRESLSGFTDGGLDAVAAVVYTLGDGKIVRGRTGVRRWFEEAVEPWESVHNQIEEVTEVADDRVLLDLLMTTRGGTSGVETTLHLWQALWFKDGWS
jgi:hypothetical protein